MSARALQSPDRNGRQRLTIASLVLLCFIAMGGVITNDFVGFDDYLTIGNNPDFNPPTFASVFKYWTEPHLSLYVPVTYTVWGALASIAQLDYSDIGGVHLNPMVFHAASVIVHAATTVVIFHILQTLAITRLAAWFGAALFAVHPIQVEAVAWASGMKDLLSGLFACASIWQYVLATKSESHARSHYIAATTCFVLAMLSKPGAVVTPLIALVIDVFLLQRPHKQIIQSIAPWLALMIPCLIWTKLVQAGEGIPAPPLWARPLIAGDAIAFYFYKLIRPWELALDYGRTPAYALQYPAVYFLWFIPALLLILAWRFRRKRPHLLASLVIFLVALLPMLGLVTFHFQYYSTVADHYLYLPMLGVALALAWIIEHYRSRAIIAIVSVLLGTYVVRSALQTQVWRDDITLFSQVISVNPNSFLAWNNLGMAQMKEGNFASAESSFRRAIEIRPGYQVAIDNLNRLHQMKMRNDE